MEKVVNFILLPLLLSFSTFSSAKSEFIIVIHTGKCLGRSVSLLHGSVRFFEDIMNRCSLRIMIFRSLHKQRLFEIHRKEGRNLFFTSAKCQLKAKTKVNILATHQPLSYNMSTTSIIALAIEKQMVPGNEVQQVELLTGVEDLYGGIILDMQKPMHSEAFLSSLRASISLWKQQGKRAVWIKLPIELVNLVEPSVKEGFVYHHAEPGYLMLVNWISNSTNTLPANASHRVGISAFVMNDKKEVLVVKEKNGKFKGKNVWKFPTGVVDEGEDFSMAAMREVKEETGIDTEFVEVLAFRQSHKSFFTKSDLLFFCMLRPLSFDIQKQDSEIEAAQVHSLGNS